jgi:hypothetical protein
MDRLSQICEQHRVSRSAFVAAAVESGIDTIMSAPRQLGQASEGETERTGKVSSVAARSPDIRASTESEPVRSETRAPEAGPADSPPAHRSRRAKKDHGIRLGRNHKTPRSSGHRAPNAAQSLPMVLPAGMELYPCPALRARITERSCAANKARAKGDLYLEACETCPGVRALAESST